MFTPEEIAAVEEAAQGYASGDFIGPNFGRRAAATLYGVLEKMRSKQSEPDGLLGDTGPTDAS